MSTKDRYVDEGFKLPSTDPRTENEPAWMHLLRSVVGDAAPPPTLAGVRALGIALMDDRREEMRRNARKSQKPSRSSLHRLQRSLNSSTRIGAFLIDFNDR